MREIYGIPDALLLISNCGFRSYWGPSSGRSKLLGAQLLTSDDIFCGDLLEGCARIP